MKGQLALCGLKQLVRLGETEAERAFPQRVTLDIVVGLDIGPCLKSDDIHDTLDYVAVTKSIERMCAELTWNLLEKLCFDIGQEILRLSPLVHEVEVACTKYSLSQVDGIKATLSLQR